MNISQFAPNIAFGKLTFVINSENTEDKARNLLERVRTDSFFSSKDNNNKLNLPCDDRFEGATVKKEKVMRGGIQYSITSPKESVIAALFEQLGVKVDRSTDSPGGNIKGALEALAKAKAAFALFGGSLVDLEFTPEKLQTNFGVTPDQVGLIVTPTGDLDFGPNFDELVAKNGNAEGQRRNNIPWH